MHSRKVRGLSTAEWNSACLGVALFEDDLWHALMGVDGFRLSDFPLGAPTEDGAKYACCLGLDIYFSLIKGTHLPPFDQIEWQRHAKAAEAAQWARDFYARPVWEHDTLFYRLVRRNRGLIPARATCQVNDRGPVRAPGRCESRRIFSW
jgi:hypothetical protein